VIKISWLVKKYKDGRFRLWESTLDVYITPALSRAKIIEFIETRWRKHLNENIKALREDFPVGWRDKETRLLL
jgi:hypothetical protein